MKHAYLQSFAIFVALGSVSSQAAEARVSFERGDTTLTLNVAGARFATYVFNDPQIPRPYFAHLHAPDGSLVTRNHPPVEGQDATDHATFHPGLWLAFGDISGADVWRNKATVKLVDFVEPPTTDERGGRFAVRLQYRAGEKLICEELCRIGIRPRPSGTLMVWDSRFSGSEEFHFGDQEEMGLGVRVATGLTVKSGGEIINSDGLRNEKQVWGKPADWCDYSGKTNGHVAGVMLLNDPHNFRRPWFHARDYGVLVANPFGQRAFTKGPLSKVVVAKGETLRLRFGILVHGGPIDRPAAYKDWLSLDELTE